MYGPADVALAVTRPIPIGYAMTWYTYDGQWHSLDVIPTIHESESGSLAEGYFDPLPASLILLTDAP
jgi:hypothetical protein